MANPKPPNPPEPPATPAPAEGAASVSLSPARPPLSAAEAAAAVGIDPSDLFAFRDYGDRVVVVTADGRKLDSAELARERGDA